MNGPIDIGWAVFADVRSFVEFGANLIATTGKQHIVTTIRETDVNQMSKGIYGVRSGELARYFFQTKV